MLTTPHSRSRRARLVACPTAVSVGLALLAGSRGATAQNIPLAPSAHREPTADAGGRRCDTAWSTLRMFRTPLGQPIYVEAPRTVSTVEGTFLIGAPTFVWADSTAFVKRESRRDVAAVGVRLLN